MFDHVFQCCGWQGGGLPENHDPIAEGHDGGDGLDFQGGGQALVFFGVELGEGDVFVLFGRLLVNRHELPAGAAPFGPGVDKHNAFLGHHVVECVFAYFYECHGCILSFKVVI